MYISLTWTICPPVDPIDVEAELYSAIENLAFDNIFNAHDNLFFADIRRGQSQWQVTLLSRALQAASAGRYSFVITSSPDYWAIAASSDIDPVALQTIAGYHT